MIELANMLLAGGVAAAAAPIIVHFAHRKRFRRIDWGAMRFVQELLLKRKRRLAIENVLLLLIRVLAIACIALALTRPQWSIGRAVEPGAESLHGPQRAVGARVAAVLLIDDSRSTSALRDGVSLLDQAKHLAAAYVDTLRAGDEVSVLALSQLTQAASDPLYDLDAVRSRLRALVSSDQRSDWPALLEAGLEQMSRHLNPHCEMVLIGDDRSFGWNESDQLRWDAIQRRLGQSSNADLGSRQRPSIIRLMPNSRDLPNWSISDISTERSLVSVGKQIPLRVTMTVHGASARSDDAQALTPMPMPVPIGAQLRVRVDGQEVLRRPFDAISASQAGGRMSVIIPYTFTASGSHLVEAELEGLRDALPADDRRAAAIDVATTCPVLVLESQASRNAQLPLGGGAALLTTALEPNGPGRDGFQVERFDISTLSGDADAERLAAALARSRVAVVGELTEWDATVLARLERFVIEGGGLLMCLGQRSDAEALNRSWYRDGSGLLPSALAAQRRSDDGYRPSVTATQHPALRAFAGRGAEAFSQARVATWLSLPQSDPPRDLSTLLSLANGDALLVERPRGNGRVMLLTTAIDGSWGDMPVRPAFVALARGSCAYLAGVVRPLRNLAVGEVATWPLTDPREGLRNTVLPAVPTLRSADGSQVIAMTRGQWQGRPAAISPPLTTIGGYWLHDPARDRPQAIAVAADPGESLGAVLTVEQHPLRAVGMHHAAQSEQVRGWFARSSGVVIELWRWLLGLGIALLLLELLVLRRASRSAASTLRHADASLDRLQRSRAATPGTMP